MVLRVPFGGLSPPPSFPFFDRSSQAETRLPLATVLRRRRQPSAPHTLPFLADNLPPRIMSHILRTATTRRQGRGDYRIPIETEVCACSLTCSNSSQF